MKIFVIYDKNGEIKSVISPGEEVEDNLSLEAPEDHSVLELNPADFDQLAELDKDAGLYSADLRKRQTMLNLRKLYRIDTKRQTIIRNVEPS